MFEDTPFLLEKSINPPNKTSSCTKKLQRFVWNSGVLDFNELQNVLAKDLKAECFANGIEKCMF